MRADCGNLAGGPSGWGMEMMSRSERRRSLCKRALIGITIYLLSRLQQLLQLLDTLQDL